MFYPSDLSVCAASMNVSFVDILKALSVAGPNGVVSPAPPELSERDVQFYGNRGWHFDEIETPTSASPHSLPGSLFSG